MKTMNHLTQTMIYSLMTAAWLLVVAGEASAQDNGACCLGDGNCVETNQADCETDTTLGGEFLGEGTLCSEADCLGACCLDDGTCTLGSADACVAGVYQGAGSTCEEYCPGPLSTGFTYQGLLQENGAAVDGPVDLEASLWTAAIGGDPVGGALNFNQVEVVGGLLSVEMDFGVEVFAGDQLWLQLTVNGTDLSPRQPVTAAPYALQTRGIFVDEANNVGIGITLPFARLTVETDSLSRAIYVHHTATTGGTFGVYGQNDSTFGRAVYGRASATSGTNFGVVGSSKSPSGFDVYASGAGTDYGSASSIRWKNNVEPIDRPLEKIARLRGVYYDWDAEHGGHHDVGMIAEEVGAVLPEIVNYEENGTDAIGMDYSKLTPLLVEAVKELRAEVKARDAKIAAIQVEKDREIADLTARLARIEKLVTPLNRTKKSQE